MQTVPGLVLCEKSEGTLIVFQKDAAGAQDIAHGGIVQVQLQQGADALQPIHQRIAVDCPAIIMRDKASPIPKLLPSESLPL